MKQSAQSESKQAPNGASGPARAVSPRQTFPPGGRLTQLAGMMNNSRRVQQLRHLQDSFAQSPRVQGLRGLAAEANHGPAAQLFGLEYEGEGAEAPETESNPATHGEMLPRETSSFAGQEVAQRKEVDTQVKGLTHLVKKKGRTIMGSDQEHEVEEPDVVTVETNDRIRSRRGPNQEEFADYDRVTPARMYRWYGIRRAPNLDNATEWYIREDTFDLGAHTPRVSTDLEQLPGRRTRQSHHLIRFEVWHNTDTNIDPTGHMMIYQFRSKVYQEYAQAREEGLITGKTIPLQNTEEARVIKESFLKLGIINAVTNKKFAKAPEPYELAVLEMSRHQARGRRFGETRPIGQSTTTVPRFNIMTWVDVMFTARETDQMDRRGQGRRARGFYYFVKEIQTVYPDATRCLSWLEDAAEIQEILDLIQGHARAVLEDYIRKKGIEPYHTGSENL